MLVDRWIDIHAHFSPPLPEDARAGVVEIMRQNCWCVEEAPSWSLERTLDYMDRTGIQMQMLSNIPKWLDGLRESNAFGAEIVQRHPDRFGLLAGLPTDDPDAALQEVARAETELNADGYAVTCDYNNVKLSDPSLDRLWAELDKRGAVVFCHPDAYRQGFDGRPAALIEVAFETTRVVTGMLYAGVFRRFPNIHFVLAHCGAALPALSGRLRLLGLESWVPNPNELTASELDVHLRRLYLDTAATCPTTLAAAVEMTTPDKFLYGSDCGVACTTDATMDRNLQGLLGFRGLTDEEKQAIGRNALKLFPDAAKRLSS